VAGSKHAFDRKIEALQALRGAADPSSARDQLARALRDRNHYLVARAAAIAAELHAEELIPDLIAAFERSFVDAVKSDPQCLAKSAIAKALRDLGHRDAATYLRGIGHVQLEPAWGGRADTAAELRGTCALALTDTHLGDLEILTHLADTLADADKLVRVNGARAIEQLNRQEGALLLRLKLLVGDPEPDALGQCFGSYLRLAPDGAVSFVSRFLQSPSEDVRLEAASALAQCRDPHAIDILRQFWREPLLSSELRRVLLITLGASPLPEAAEFLLGVVTRASVDLATCALTALATGRYRTALRPRIAAVVQERDSSELTRIFEATFAPIEQNRGDR
jgi:HEAT repeat protein